MIERAYGVDCRNGDVNQDVNGTLQAKPGGGKPKYKYRGTYSLSHEGFMCRPIRELCGALLATGYKDPPVVIYERRDTDG